MSNAIRNTGKRVFWAVAPYLPSELRLKILFVNTHGSWPDLSRPKSFSEKVQWRKLHDRRKILTLFADKYRVRQHVEERIGRRYLTTVYWASEDPRSLPLADLPDRFVLKANHGTRWNIMVEDKKTADREQL